MWLYLFEGLNTSDQTVIKIAHEVGESFHHLSEKPFPKVPLSVKQLPADWLCISEMNSVELEISLPALQIGTLPALEI